MTAEISFDLVEEADMAFEEGTFRLAGGDWQVFIFTKRPVSAPEICPTTWDSGISGFFVAFPTENLLNRATVKLLLSQALGVSEWVDVRGPDSIHLR